MTDKLPLDGVRVVEFSHMIMGPTCGLALGDLGADVVKVVVTALGQRMKPLLSTMDLQPGVSHVEVAAAAFGDAEFTEVSS